ncbi:hypothetical protein DERP_007439 [Dermatophagoides pteronyssinus]|uniref:Uncharacterized protein n=1 Tax=Dermatophagoides pteronyssinus TaxID=6956 RepID=A0ABQ8J4G4_DERPT|nr:hypothetical protein DERP_007439 [Dermatophagoides pteronyssinus]
MCKYFTNITIVRKRSKIAAAPFRDTSSNFAPHSFKNAIATSIESFVAFSSNKIKISRAKISCATFWLIRCAINLVLLIQFNLSFR